MHSGYPPYGGHHHHGHHHGHHHHNHHGHHHHHHHQIHFNSEEQVYHGLHAGVLVKARLYIPHRHDDKRSYAHYLHPDGSEGSIQINSINDRNGAMHGSIVAVQTWANNNAHAQAQFCGKVVWIFPRPAEEGPLLLIGKSNPKNPSWFVPYEDKYPEIQYAMLCQPADPAYIVEVVVDEIAKKCKVRSVIADQSPSLPSAEFLAIRKMYGIPDLPFPDDVVQNATQIATSSLPLGKYQRVLPEEVTIITVDDECAGLLDDAISCTISPEDPNTAIMSVYIVDAAYYIPEGSLVDKEAQFRGENMYLHRWVVPMVPAILAEKSSLTPGEDKLVMELAFVLDLTNGTVKEEKFRRCVVQNSCRVSYEQMESVLISTPFPEGKELVMPETNTDPNLTNKVIETLKAIGKVSDALFKRRQSRGHIRKPRQEQLHFKSNKEVLYGNPEYGVPIGMGPKVKPARSDMAVEECMVLANSRVARYLCKTFPHHAVIQTQEAPNATKIQRLLLDLNVLPPHRMHEPLAVLAELRETHPLGELITRLAMKFSSKSNYVVHDPAQHPREEADAGGDGDVHITNASACTQWYTHFTSPMRRYVDLVAHRLLAKSLEGITMLPPEVAHHHATIAAMSSSRKPHLRHARERIETILLGIYLGGLPAPYSLPAHGPLLTKGIITQVNEYNMTLHVPQLCREVVLKGAMYAYSQGVAIIPTSGGGSKGVSILDEVDLVITGVTDRVPPSIETKFA